MTMTAMTQRATGFTDFPRASRTWTNASSAAAATNAMEKYTIVSPSSAWACSNGDRALPVLQPFAGFGGQRREDGGDDRQSEHQPRQPSARRRPQGADDGEHGGQRRQDDDEVHEQDVGGKPVDRRHILFLNTFRDE